MSRPRSYSLDPWIASVTKILIISRGRALNPCGVGNATGFFYQKNEQKYLITNKHVVIQEENEFYPDSIQIRVHESNVSFENRDIMIPLYDENRKPIWLEHSNNNVDVIAIDINSYLTSPIFITPWSNDNFLASDEILPLGHQTLILGYPMGFYDETHNFPIVKGGTLASPYPIHFRGNPFFLIDANLTPGNSGSPVILPRRTTKFDINGVVVGNYPPSLLGIFSSEYLSRGIKLGLNTVWYAELIDDII